MYRLVTLLVIAVMLAIIDLTIWVNSHLKEKSYKLPVAPAYTKVPMAAAPTP
jgi:hypothetical protein